MSCEETREHLESCEECRLHVVVEARLRTQPVLEPPKGLTERVMKSLPRAVPVKREFFRLAAAAALLLGMAAAFVGTGLNQHEKLDPPRQAIERTFSGALATVTDLGSRLWNR